MTGTLAQIIAITSFGNDYLKSGKLIDFYPQNSTFQHCNFVDFREMRNKKEVVIAKNPIEWFKYLESKKCLKLRLFYQSSNKDDYKFAGFVGGGGNWFIETIFSQHSDLWVSHWDYNKKLDKKPWQVTYEKVYEKQSIINQELDIDQTREKLKICLGKITEFAFQETSENWGNIFKKAYNTLKSRNPKFDFYHSDLIFWNNYDLQNQQLLMSASKAFVFGGMGSWNDVRFEKEEVQDIYNKLSAELYDAIIKSIICAINKDKIDRDGRKINFEIECKSYMELTKLCCSAEIQAKILPFLSNLQNSQDENDYDTLHTIIEFLGDNDCPFIVSLDWKQEVKDLEVFLNEILQKNYNGMVVDFPKYNDGNFLADVFESFDETLKKNNLQFAFMGAQSDEHVFVVHRVCDKEKVEQLINNIGYYYFDAKEECTERYIQVKEGTSSGYSLNVFIILLMLCLLFSSVAYRSFLKEGFSFWNIPVIIAIIGLVINIIKEIFVFLNKKSKKFEKHQVKK